MSLPNSLLFWNTQYIMQLGYLILLLLQAKHSETQNLLREGEDSFSCICIPWPGGREGSSSTMSPQEVFCRHDSRAAQTRINVSTKATKSHHMPSDTRAGLSMVEGL